MPDYKALYVEMLKKYDDDICKKCLHQQHCDGKNCPDYICGDTVEIDGETVKNHWSCEDFDWGSCTRLEGTPCHGCFDSGLGNFVLREDL